jgi:aryl-alcohol dehydrogenase-like predicted oxidoreductase
MGMSDLYGPADRAESIATVHAALEAGITLLDTGDFYGMGHNELLLRDALAGRPRDSYLLSVKFGAQRDVAGAWLGYDARPAAVKTALAYTLRRLGTEYVDVYRPARLDRSVPIEETVGAIAECIAKGWVRYAGLSEVGAATIRRAHAVHPIADVQIEYSLVSRDIERDILPACRALGIGVTAYGVLSRGLISGRWTRDRALVANDIRNRSPRFRAENLDRNLALVGVLQRNAEAKGITTVQLAIAWVLARGDDVVPLIGARTRERLTEALGALGVTLDASEIGELERAFPPGSAAGGRYDEHQMAVLDSERR